MFVFLSQVGLATTESNHRLNSVNNLPFNDLDQLLAPSLAVPIILEAKKLIKYYL